MKKINENKVKATMYRLGCKVFKAKYAEIEGTDTIYFTNNYQLVKIKKKNLTEKQLANAEEYDFFKLETLYNNYSLHKEDYKELSYDSVIIKNETDIVNFVDDKGNIYRINKVFYDLLKEYNVKIYAVKKKTPITLITEDGFIAICMPIVLPEDR